MTRKQFKDTATAIFLRQNPTASVDWITARFVTYPTGVQGWQGRFYATAPGYRPRIMAAAGDDTGVMVR